MHLLIIEDDVGVRQAYRHLFEKPRRVRLTFCQTYAEAKLCLDRDPPRLIICDGRLPEDSGWNIIKRLRTTLRRNGRDLPPVIAVSADDDEASVRSWSNAGVTCFHRKPFDAFELLTDVSRLTDGPAPGDRRTTTTH